MAASPRAPLRLYETQILASRRDGKPYSEIVKDLREQGLVTTENSLTHFVRRRLDKIAASGASTPIPEALVEQITAAVIARIANLLKLDAQTKLDDPANPVQNPESPDKANNPETHSDVALPGNYSRGDIAARQQAEKDITSQAKLIMKTSAARKKIL